jgi:hypothetical protein
MAHLIEDFVELVVIATFLTSLMVWMDWAFAGF